MPQRLRWDVSGATIVEFAIVCIPFFVLMFGIFETGLLFFRREILQTAVTEAGRLVYTGAAQANGYNAAQFKQKVCDRLTTLVACDTVAVDVRTYTNFASAQRFNPVDADGNFSPNGASFSPGSTGTIVMVTGFSRQPLLFPMLGEAYSSAGPGHVLVRVTAVFRNEPYIP